jgi:hypothetical protein
MIQQAITVAVGMMKDRKKAGFERCTVPASCLPLIVASEAGGPLNPPHSNPSTGRRSS